MAWIVASNVPGKGEVANWDKQNCYCLRHLNTGRFLCCLLSTDGSVVIRSCDDPATVDGASFSLSSARRKGPSAQGQVSRHIELRSCLAYLQFSFDGTLHYLQKGPIDLVDGDDEVLDAEQRADERVAVCLLEHALARIDQDDRQVTR